MSLNVSPGAGNGIRAGATQASEHGRRNEAAGRALRGPSATYRFQKCDQVAFDLQPPVTISIAELKVRNPTALAKTSSGRGSGRGPRDGQRRRRSLRRSTSPIGSADCRWSPAGERPAAVQLPVRVEAYFVVQASGLRLWPRSLRRKRGSCLAAAKRLSAAGTNRPGSKTRHGKHLQLAERQDPNLKDAYRRNSSRWRA